MLLAPPMVRLWRQPCSSTRPSLLAGAILVRSLSPFANDLPNRLDGTPVLIIDGEKDSRRSPGDGLRLAERLIRAGATVTHHLDTAQISSRIVSLTDKV